MESNFCVLLFWIVWIGFHSAVPLVFVGPHDAMKLAACIYFRYHLIIFFAGCGTLLHLWYILVTVKGPCADEVHCSAFMLSC